MLLSQLPAKIVRAFAKNGSRNVVPVESQIGIVNGAASYEDGFPPLTMTPLASGGIPPDGRNMNGVLYDMSSLLLWLNAGGTFMFDAVFASNVGGYPKGCLLANPATLGKFWLCTQDGNSHNPDAGDTVGWLACNLPGFTPVEQGGVSGQMTSKINLGWTAANKPRIAVNGSDVDNIALETWTNNAIAAEAIARGLQDGYIAASLTAEAATRAAVDTNEAAFSAATYVHNVDINGAFNTSPGGSGYQKIWGGTIFQWGKSILRTGAGDFINFPIAFPNAPLQIVASDFGSGDNLCAGVIYPPWSPGAFQAFARPAGASSGYLPGVAFGYFAIGY